MNATHFAGFALIVGLLGVPEARAAENPIPRIDHRPFSSEGRMEPIRVEFTSPVEGDVFLQVHTFHYIMHPDMAPPQDTWSHSRQMSHMRDVLEGRSQLLSPDPSDPKLQAILTSSPAQSIRLEAEGPSAYSVRWPARHGRIFFRVRLGDEILEPVSTMRVHCTHVDTRSIENLKGALRLLALPLQHSHREKAQEFMQGIQRIYGLGHGLRFMLTHHEEDIGPELDRQLSRLAEAVSASRLEEASSLLDSLMDQLRIAESLFRKVEARWSGQRLSVAVSDRVGFPYQADPRTEVYARQLSSPGAGTGGHSMPSSGDHADHQKAMAADREALTKGAIRLERGGGRFEGEIPAGWGKLEVVVIYGLDQAYYFTQEVDRDEAAGVVEGLLDGSPEGRPQSGHTHTAARVHPGEAKRLAALLGLKEGSVIADVGAGEGALAMQLAPIVGKSGKVIATEIDAQLVAKIRELAASEGLSNLSAVMGSATDTGLEEASCDAVVLRMVYHHFDHPEEMMAGIFESLRPEGRLAVVEWDRRSLSPQGYGPAGLAERLARSGFELVEVARGWNGIPAQYCAVFRRASD